MALITRYKLLSDLPGIPAGEAFAKYTGDHNYQGETTTDCWFSENAIENNPTQFQFVSVTDDSGVPITIIQTTSRMISRDDLLNRITTPELTALMEAVQINPAVAAWKVRFDSHEKLFNLDSKLLLEGFKALEGAGIFAAGRVAELVA